MKFRAAAGSRFTHRDAALIGKRLQKLGGSDGVTAKEVVQDARPVGSPLHRYFEWNNTKAAAAYRETQAREMLRCVIVVEDDKDEGTRGFHAVVVEGERRYVPQTIVFNTPSLREQVIEEARQEVRAWQNRYKRYKFMASAVDAMEQVARRIPKRKRGKAA